LSDYNRFNLEGYSMRNFGWVHKPRIVAIVIVAALQPFKVE